MQIEPQTTCFGFGARTGDYNNYHHVRNMRWYNAGLLIIEPALVTLYEAIDYGGKLIYITKDISNLGDYCFNDVASSIKVPSGCNVTLYADANYTGSAITRTTYDSTFVDNSFNDMASSVKIEGGGFNFGNVYLVTNDPTTRDYNKLKKKKTFKFKNSETEPTSLRWSISTNQNWIKFSKSSGTLTSGCEETIDVWVEPTGSPGDYNGAITFTPNLTPTGGDIEIAVSAKAFKTAQLSHVSPAKGTNERVNVAEGESVQYEVKADGPFLPEATLDASGYSVEDRDR